MPGGRWIKRGMVGLVAAAGGALLAGAGVQAVAGALSERRYEPPGRMVDVGGYSLHIDCHGQAGAGRPTVVLEAGFGGFSIDWSGLGRPAPAGRVRVCAYDRPGMGWSDARPGGMRALEDGVVP